MDARTSHPEAGHEARIVAALIDTVALRILVATSQRARSVRDLAVELQMPLASLYRKVNELHAAGALCSSEVRDGTSGKSTRVYASAVAALRVDVSRGAPLVDLTLVPTVRAPPL